MLYLDLDNKALARAVGACILGPMDSASRLAFCQKFALEVEAVPVELESTFVFFSSIKPRRRQLN